MFDLISIGDITVDLFFKGDSLTEQNNKFSLSIGGKYLANHFYESLGGGGANVAVGASTHGLNTAVLGKIGENSFKQIIIQKLIKKRVSTEFLLCDKDFINISTILVAKGAERTIIHYLTPDQNLNLSEMMLKNLTKTQFVYMGNLPDIRMAEKVILAKYFKSHGVKICLNLGMTDLITGMKKISEILGLADIFIINTEEYAALVKKNYKSINFEKNCANTIGMETKLLILTDGKNGSYCYFEDKIFFQKAAKAEKVIDTTGTGDAYTSAFLAAYIKEQSIEESMDSAAQYASQILGRIGAQ